MIESFVPVPILDLDAPVPQMVEQLGGFLVKVFDQSLPEQVIEVPKITLQEGVPHRAALRKPQLAETVGGSADDPWLRSCCRGCADLGVEGSTGSA